MIGEDIRVTVLEIRGGKVRIGVDAPKELKINRVQAQSDRASDAHDAKPAKHITTKTKDGCD